MSRKKEAAFGAANTESGRERGRRAATQSHETIVPRRRYRRKAFLQRPGNDRQEAVM